MTDETKSAALESWAARDYRLSEIDAEFKARAHGDPAYARRSSFAAVDAPHTLLRYRPQPWPTFVHKDLMDELGEASKAVSRLLRQVPEKVFRNDPVAIGETVDLAPHLVALILEPPNGIPEALSRGDFLLTKNGFKCVEFNVASTLGGWDTGVLTEILLGIDLIRDFMGELDDEVRYDSASALMLEHVILEALKDPDFRKEGVHIAVAMREDPSAVEGAGLDRHMEREMKPLMERLAPGVPGSARVVNRYQNIEFRNGKIYHDGDRLAAIIERHQPPSDNNVYRAFKAGGLKLYDGPLPLILSDKRLLVALSEAAETGVYSPQDSALIDRFVPWTRPVRQGEVRFRGDDYELGELLRSRQAELVLKKGKSLGGKHVSVGVGASQETWDHFCDKALSEGGWLVQEYQEPVRYDYQCGEEGIYEHDLVWGPFVSGETFGGAVLRMQPSTDGGVVNLTGNASEGIIFEVSR